MMRAHLSIVSLAKRENDTAGDKIDNLNADKHHVSNQRCVYQEKQRRHRPDRECRQAQTCGAALFDQVVDLGNVAHDHQSRADKTNKVREIHKGALGPDEMDIERKSILSPSRSFRLTARLSLMSVIARRTSFPR
jgi:hypothetical protein